MFWSGIRVFQILGKKKTTLVNKMVSKEIKKKRDELRGEASIPKREGIKKEIQNIAVAERATRPPTPRTGTTLRTGSPEQKQRLIEAEVKTEKTEADVAKEQRAALPTQQISEQLRQAGAFEEVTPQEVSLQPETGEGLLAPQKEALLSGAQENSLIGVLRKKGKIKDLPTGEEEFGVPVTPETEREAALRQVKVNSFNKGLSQRESFGSVIEAIPLVGKLIGKYVGGVVEAPYANQKNVLGEINKLKEAASTGQEKVRNGLEDPDYGLGRAREMEEDIAKLEGRIQLLINSSAVLRANTDEVNLIQEQILEAREKISRYRTASEFGLTAQLTRTGRVIPTDEQLYFELKGGK